MSATNPAESPLATLRRLLAEPPSEGVWQELCAVFEGEATFGVLEVAVEYAAWHLTDWPWALRVAPTAWLADRVDAARFHVASTISLRRPRDPIDDLLGDPALRYVRGLILRGRGIAPGELRTMSHTPVFSGLEQLDLSGTLVGQDPVEVLAEAPRTRPLRWLSLRANPLGPTAGALLAHHPVFAALEHLDVRGCQLDDHSARPLIEAFPEARVLLTGNLLGPELAVRGDPEVTGPRALDLRWLSGPSGARHIRLYEGQRLLMSGTRECDVALRSHQLAGVHLVVRGTATGFEVVDRGCLDPLRVSARAAECTPIADGDVITVGTGQIDVVHPHESLAARAV